MNTKRSAFPILWISVILVVILSVSCNRNGNDSDSLPTDLITNPGTNDGNSQKMPVISFAKTEHDFGTIKEGQKVYWNFRFKNTGNADLIINRVKADCGCTVPEYPKTPIAPGEEGKIKVTFDSKSRMGVQVKNVTVLSNSERSTIVLTINAIVEKSN